MGASTPSAGSITVGQTLDLLEGRFSSVASGIADGRYVLWLGSGISRERLPDLRTLIRKVLEFLQANAVAGDPSWPHRRALELAVEYAGLRGHERAQFDLDDPVSSWPVLDLVLDGLAGRYSEFLAIQVKGEAADYLLWNAVDVRAAYGPGTPPDCEHLCIAILALEGVVSQAASPNWDGLIEAAFAELGVDPDAVLRVIVLSDDLREPERALTLIKFHGCAVLAAKDPGRYRDALIATRPQITAWSTSGDSKVIRAKLVELATTKSTLVVGLSAQDENIQQVFAQARADMTWTWPSDPPAHVFAGGSLGDHHLNILRVVYNDVYNEKSEDIESQAFIPAYAKRFLTALVLFVLTRKLGAYAAEVDAPHLSAADREQLGLKCCDLVGSWLPSEFADPLCQRSELAASSDELYEHALPLLHPSLKPCPCAFGVALDRRRRLQRREQFSETLARIGRFGVGLLEFAL